MKAFTKRHSLMVKLKPLIKVNDIEHELSMSRKEILNVIDKWASEGSGWVIDSINNHYIKGAKGGGGG